MLNTRRTSPVPASAWLPGWGARLRTNGISGTCWTHLSPWLHSCRHAPMLAQVGQENETLRARVATQPVNKADLNRLIMDR